MRYVFHFSIDQKKKNRVKTRVKKQRYTFFFFLCSLSSPRRRRRRETHSVRACPPTSWSRDRVVNNKWGGGSLLAARTCVHRTQAVYE